MKLDIHPSAASNLDKKAIELVNLITEIPFIPQSQPSFSSDRHAVLTLTEKDIIGEVEMSASDYRGRTVAKYFHINNKKYGIETESYLKLIELSEKLQDLPSIYSKLSLSLIETKLFTWVRKKFNNENVSDSFIHFLDQETETSIKTITLWIPIANLEIEVPFSISKSELRPISKKVIDQWEQKIIEVSGNNEQWTTSIFNDIRSKYQGLTAVVTTVEAESQRAYEFAMEEAERITSILGIFSGAVLIPDIKCVSKIKGSENIAQATCIMESNDDCVSIKTTMIDISSAKTLRLSENDIREMNELFFNRISHLFSVNSLNAFEKVFLNSIMLYSKAAFTSAPVEKLIYILSALESILLKDGNEPIQQNLSERLAFFIAKELADRKHIIKTVKSIYAIRSKYLHHGHYTHSELGTMSDFMLLIFNFFMKLATNLEKFKTKDDFICVIDDYKLAG